MTTNAKLIVRLLLLLKISVMLVVMTDLSPSVHQETHFISAHVGESITLRCLPDYGVVTWFYWYKVSPGQRPKLILTVYKFKSKIEFFEEFADDPRLSLDTKGVAFHLTIRDVHFNDSATYYCANSFVEKMQFAEGTTVSVVGSGINIPALVRQIVSENSQTEVEESLNCTVHADSCEDENCFYWFQNPGGRGNGVIYTKNERMTQRKEVKTRTQTCYKNLPTQVLTAPHDGNQHCAILLCGHILFKNWTELDLQSGVDVDVLVLSLSGAVVFSNTLSVLMGLCVWSLKMRRKCICKKSRISTENEEDCKNQENLYDDVGGDVEEIMSLNHLSDNIWSQCVYFGVEQWS